MSKALVLLAEGAEEMEAVIAADVLRRAGVEVTIAAIGTVREVTASRGVRLVADVLLAEVRPVDYDALVLPGGAGGAKRLASDGRVLEIVRQFVAAQKTVAAVCAGPLVLQAAGVLSGVRATCHPGVREQFAGKTEERKDGRAETATGPRVCDDRVVEDGVFITSQGPGTSMEFALAIARRLVDEATARKVAEGLILPRGVA